ncbi:MFS transporter [Paraburkholderia domus]|uniref:MFS transporter n=1 Tax=Paraburkholderia domus TaxID=2793075 RepID=UPI001913CFAD|nr:MFS transporter [Paraburkholderia domus]MBK5064279.1 MFS transporter [Burkholderia sp. R-70199]MBK5122728.1 MFS transporter [Burkholderia sp. R-69980]MCI0149613.1 MFS transporter [Paraburkholderia sediminicola]CAE6760404.1 putative MFS-type transporter YcaD [Paraburkholderia domus]CAE6939413.1 putative MFS-type transporter YcaD [Paraburkholderia domus]
MNAAAPVRWAAIAALTSVSALSQIGQFGIGFMVLPVWLAHQGIDAPRAGLFSASQWTGMLAGLLIAPWLVERIGAKRTVSLGLAATIVAFATMNALWWPLWLVPGLLTGLGIGLRWIANETWLYRLVPAESSGRVVGVHEALIASAGVIGPALAVWCAVDARITFAAGAAFTFAAAVPLWLTTADDGRRVVEAAPPARRRRIGKCAPIGPLVSLGMVVVAAGGIGDGALYGLFPLFADAHGLNTTQTATLLTLFGVGGMALQFPVGWFADRAGLAATVIVCAALSTLAICGFSLAALASWLADASAVLLGGMNSAYITLGMVAAACSDKAALTRNMRLVSLTFTASSIVGPLIAGFAMKARGSDMLMWQLAIMSGALVAYTLGLREGRRQPDRSSSMG